jgi:hypothetical protein
MESLEAMVHGGSSFIMGLWDSSFGREFKL